MAVNTIGTGQTCVSERTGTIDATIYFSPCEGKFQRSSPVACGVKGCNSTIRKGGYRVTGDALACASSSSPGGWLDTRQFGAISYSLTDVGMAYDTVPTVTSTSVSIAFHGNNTIRCLLVPGGSIEDLVETFTGTLTGTI